MESLKRALAATEMKDDVVGVFRDQLREFYPDARVLEPPDNFLSWLALGTRFYPETRNLNVNGYTCDWDCMIANPWTIVARNGESFSDSDLRRLVVATRHLKADLLAREESFKLDSLTGLPRRRTLDVHLRDFLHQMDPFSFLFVEAGNTGTPQWESPSSL